MGISRQLYQLQEIDQEIDAEEQASKQRSSQLGESQALVTARDIPARVRELGFGTD